MIERAGILVHVTVVEFFSLIWAVWAKLIGFTGPRIVELRIVKFLITADNAVV